MIAPGDLLFLVEPWSHYGPDDFERPENPLMSDVVTAFFPYYYATKQALSMGEWPLWNPLQYAGMPLLANAQSAVFYPPRLLHYFFDVPTATTLYILLKLWLCGMTAFVCALALKLPLASARFFSVAWMFCAYNLIWPNWSLPDVSIWLPVLFLGVERLLHLRFTSGTALVAIGGAMLLYAGHPETAFAMSLGVGVYMAVRLALLLGYRPESGRRIAVALGGASLGWMIALAVTAPMVLPFAEYLLHSSTYFDRPDQGHNYIYPPSALASFFAPRYFGASSDLNYYGDLNSNLYMMLYPGVAVLLLLGLLLRRPAGSGEDTGRLVALTVMALWGIVVSFGFSWFNGVHRLPVFSSMIEAYHITATVFALPLLAAHGLARLLAEPPQRGDFGRVLALPVLGGALLLFLYFWNRPVITLLGSATYVRTEMYTALGLCLLGLALLLFWQRRRLGGGAVAALLTILLFVDLVYAGRNLNPTIEKSQLYPETELTTFLQSQPTPTRVAVGMGYIPTGLLACYGIEDWLAYDGLYPARMSRFQVNLGSEIWTSMEPATAQRLYLHNPLFPVQFPLEDRPESFQLLASHDGIEIYENLEAFPRAYVSGGLEMMDDEAQLFARMKEPAFDPRRAVLGEQGSGIEALEGQLPKSGAFAGAAEITDYTMNTVEIAATTEGPGILVLADAWYPGWKAEINGEAAPIFPVNYGFRGVFLPRAGEYAVRLAYRPTSFYLGLGLSATVLLLVLGLGLYRLVRAPQGSRI